MTFYLVDACNEVGPKDVVLCAKCFGHSTVRATEIEVTDPTGGNLPVCENCGVTWIAPNEDSE